MISHSNRMPQKWIIYGSNSNGNWQHIRTVPASGTADVYLGEAGIKCNGQVSIATPNAGSVTLILG
jgi:hypothetical protein